MKHFLDLLKLRFAPQVQTVDLSGIEDDIGALFKDNAKNKYRIEELDIRLANLQEACKELFKAG